MTNQRSNKQLVLNNFPPTTKGWKINKSLSVGPARPFGRSVCRWLGGPGCSVWGLGWSHNCFLWAAQPPEPLHNWLSGWYSPPPSFPLIPQTPTPSSPLQRSLLPLCSSPLFLPSSQSVNPFSQPQSWAKHFPSGLVWMEWVKQVFKLLSVV